MYIIISDGKILIFYWSESRNITMWNDSIEKEKSLPVYEEQIFEYYQWNYKLLQSHNTTSQQRSQSVFSYIFILCR